MEDFKIYGEEIERYVSGEMSTAEASAFESEMADHPALAAQVETELHIMEAFTRKSERGALEELLAIGSEKELRRATGMGKRLPGRKSFLGRHSGLIVPTLVCVGVALLFFGYMPKYSSTELYDQAVTFPVYKMSEGEGAPEMDEENALLMEWGRGLYDSEDYAGALAVWERIFNDLEWSEIPDEILFSSGISHLALGEYPQARFLFDNIMEKEDSRVYREAEWYSVLSRLAQDERLAVRKILEDIVTRNESPYAGQAAELIKKIKAKRWF